MAWRVVRSRAARRDLEDLWFFVAQQDEAAAGRLLDRIQARIEQLSALPNLGRVRDDIAPGLRGKLAGRAIILYRLEQSTRRVVILRVLDGRRDLASLFEEG